jgi:hypothetical protein
MSETSAEPRLLEEVFMAKQESPVKRGRPTAYREDYARQVFVAAAETGMTDAQLSQLFGVNPATLNRWKQEHPDFCESLKAGRDIFDTANVEKSLLRRAMGYQTTETIREVSGDGNLEITKTVQKTVPPDTTAMIFWLKNRHPDRWREKQVIAHEGGVKIANTIDPETKSILASILDAARLPEHQGEGALPMLGPVYPHMNDDEL